jgi:hypothetical protein
MAARYNVVARKGETFRRDLTWREPRNADGTPGDPKDLTGWSGEVFIGELGPFPADVLVEVPPALADPNIHIEIEADITALWDFAAVRWLVRLTDIGGDTQDLLEGSFQLEEVPGG